MVCGSEEAQKEHKMGVFVYFFHTWKTNYQLALFYTTSVVCVLCAVVDGSAGQESLFVKGNRHHSKVPGHRIRAVGHNCVVTSGNSDQSSCTPQITSRGDHPPRDPTISFQPHRGGCTRISSRLTQPWCRLHRSAFN